MDVQNKIQIRLWDPEKKEMMYTVNPQLYAIHTDNSGLLKASMFLKPCDLEISLSTFRDDHKKNRVYVGDVLEHKYATLLKWLVVYENSQIGIVNIGNNGYRHQFIPIDSSIYYFEDRIVIGNIYANPELIEAQNV